MNKLGLLENKVQGLSPLREHRIALVGTVPSIQRLLDVISSILAKEYIAIAKQHPGVFSRVTSGKIGTVPIFHHNNGR